MCTICTCDSLLGANVRFLLTTRGCANFDFAVATHSVVPIPLVLTYCTLQRNFTDWKEIFPELLG